MKTIRKYKTKKEEIKAKRNNAKMLPIYKMFSWDLLFFYSTQYLFYTSTKGLTPGEVLKVEAFSKKLDLKISLKVIFVTSKI